MPQVLYCVCGHLSSVHDEPGCLVERCECVKFERDSRMDWKAKGPMLKGYLIPKGARVTVTSGYYDDFAVKGFFVATQDLDCDALAKEWLALPAQLKAEEGLSYDFIEGPFLAWVIDKGLLKQDTNYTWHLGCVENMEPTHDVTWHADGVLQGLK
jgi:hypothetical protein